MVHSRSLPPRLRRPPPLFSCSGERFKGVRRRSWGRWVSEIRIPHSRNKIWLGSYSTAEQAARAYDIASLLLRGSSCSAYLNFSDSTALISTDDQLAALVAGGIASPRTIQVTAQATASATVNSTLVKDGAGCSNSGSSPDMDENNCSERRETSSKDCGFGVQCLRTDQCMVETTLAAHPNICSSMPDSCWIQDVLTVIISPKDRSSPPSVSYSLQLSPSKVRCSVPRPLSSTYASAAHVNSCHGFQCSSKVTTPDYLLQTLFDDYQYPLEDLVRDGFTAISPAVTTSQRIDTETGSPSCEADSTELWSYAC